MSLQNLLKIGQLKAHPPDAAEVQRLLLVTGGVQVGIWALGAGKAWFRAWHVTTGEGVRV